jgi:chromosome segregation ATPase
MGYAAPVTLITPLVRPTSLYTGGMDLPTPSNGLEALAKLGRELAFELDGLAAKRSGLARELEALDKDVESTRRMLELVEATRRQLAAQERRQQAIERGGAPPSTQVRASATLEDMSAMLPT